MVSGIRNLPPPARAPVTRAQKHQSSGEPPPPGTAADRPPPSAAATARLEAALVHKVTALLGAGGDDSEGRHDDAATLVEILAEATADGIDVARYRQCMDKMSPE